ncbi:MAG: NAD-dependent epimerase/dehydratase family protein [Parachlamydiales bacterium]|jgi:GDP-L-fucose synthase
MKILITGASGFLGKFLYKKLISLGHDVTGISSKTNDLTKFDSLNTFNNIRFDQIYHLAAWTQAGDFCLTHAGEQWIINQKINTNVLSYWQKYQPQAKMIAMGTSCSYDPALALVEENYLLGRPIDSLFTYAMTKRMLLAGLLALKKQFDLEFLYLIPSTLYGEEYHLDGRQMHFIFDLMRKIVKGKFNNDKVILWGDGYQKRELIHVQDFVNIMVVLAQRESGEIINIGSGEELSIRDFAQKICNIISYDEKKIMYDESKYVGAKSKVLVIDKLKKKFPDLKMLSLNEGLASTVDWFIKNKDVLTK